MPALIIEVWPIGGALHQHVHKGRPWPYVPFVYVQQPPHGLSEDNLTAVRAGVYSIVLIQRECSIRL